MSTKQQPYTISRFNSNCDEFDDDWNQKQKEQEDTLDDYLKDDE